MINLLPPEQKEEILFRKRLNLILILGILCLSFLISLILVLFFAKNYFLWNLETQKIFIKEREREISLNKDLEETIKESNLSFSKLNSFYKTNINLTQVLERISEILPSNTYLTSFKFSPIRGEEKAFQISLTGVCPNREILLLFKKKLEEEKSFSNVYFPPENWVQSTNVQFKVFFKLNGIKK